MEDKEYIQLTERHAVIDLPENAIEIHITAKVYENGKIQEVGCVYTLEEIRKAFKEADDYIGPDDLFVLTDKGREFLDGIKGNNNE